ncbi:hypothetical protein [Lysinibacillus boronitolerans]|uniref:hypothetical protein n=1 Tax=Lysinibacillus boronitolerans TaxID=309788 RepID=UPI00289EE679|nr:hypothetical protein [Lysinibacillus boronitolerans]
MVKRKRTNKSKKGKKLKWIKNGWLWLGVVILLLPIGVNILANNQPPFGMHVSKNNQWVGFFASYLGGVIGGLFTWLGVTATLKEERRKNNLQERKDIEDRVAIQRYYADKVEEVINQCVVIQQMFNKKKYRELRDLLAEIVTKEEINKEYAIKVDGRFYVSVITFHDFAGRLLKYIDGYGFEYPSEKYPHIENNLQECKDIVDFLEESRSNFDVEYTRVTRNFFSCFFQGG